jgi:DNA helicase-2/ATP-dependent DNA helicase PcrA
MKIKLSDQAKHALNADGHILVLGGPGSGKTTLALLKAKKLIASIKPGQDILFLSFSRSAVRQVQIRCRDILTSSEKRQISVKTYHSFCMDLLKSHGRLLTGKAPRILYPAAARLAKLAYTGDWDVESQRLAHEEALYCFEQFAPSCVELLTRASCVRQLLSQQHPVIVVDEFQDTDDAQWELVRLLSQCSRLIALADPDQRIFDHVVKINPERLNQLREFRKPAEFNLGAANHRSPDTSILGFAEAVLRNEALPATSDVVLASYWGREFKASAHYHILLVCAQLRKKGINAPTIAVLCRSNSFVAEISALLDDEHSFNGQTCPPLNHYVVWDAELTSAAAQVIGSILEWPELTLQAGVAATLEHIANYYDMKTAEHPSKSARQAAYSYRTAAIDVKEGRVPRLQAAKQLIAHYKAGIPLRGTPEADWLQARGVIAAIPKLSDLCNSARVVRLYRAKDELGSELANKWLTSGGYGRAAETVRRILETRQLVSANTEPNGVVLMTLHKAKGKEFDGVVIIEGQYKGSFFRDRDSEEDRPHSATRRLLRVGITRARYRVCILRPNGARKLTDQ